VLVSLGLGSVIAAVVEFAPWLMAIGRHKGIVFASVGVLLALNYWLAIVRPRQKNCAPDEICYVDSPAMRVNRALFWSSVTIYLVAVSFTYGALFWIARHP
jgi:hypothetical protein